MRHAAYRHAQISWTLWLTLPTAGLAAVGVVLSGNGITDRVQLFVVGLVVAVQVGVLLALGWLTIEVGEGSIEWRFGLLGRPRWRLPLADIVSAAPARSTWLEGWGIRKTTGGMLYNASGLDAVRLTLRDGRVIRLGSPEPERLVAFIEARLRPG